MALTNYEFLTQQITAAQNAIMAYNEARIQLGTSGIQSYTIDTGQSKQTVTRANLTEIQNMINSLNNELAVLCARRDGGNVFTGGPAW